MLLISMIINELASIALGWGNCGLPDVAELKVPSSLDLGPLDSNK